MRDNLTYSELLDVLTGLVDEKTSGTLFIRTDSNHVITIALDAGQIYAMFYSARRGRKAIPLISNIAGGSYKLESSGLKGISHDLPSTPEILNLLRNPHVAEESGPDSGAGASGGEITDKNKTILCQELKNLLAEHLGPIAEMVFDDTVDEAGDFCATPELAQALVSKLAADIDDADEVEQFKSRAYAAINRMLRI
ncbi:MAG: hypothetical protein C0631_00275 [Sedimenticola sp.]|nr:MAG: hypothetical protein C0631_00275 [Sedimenticola sp.]